MEWCVVLSVIVLSSFRFVESSRLDLFASYNAYDNRLTGLNASDAVYELEEDLQRLNCKQIHVTALLRHGATHPREGELRKVEELIAKLKKLRGSDNSAVTSLLASIEEWREQVVAAGVLTQQGKQQMSGLGEWYRGMFGGVLSGGESVKLVSSHEEKVKESCRAFKSGFAPDAASATCETNDDSFLFFEQCSLYRAALRDQSRVQEVIEFRAGPEVQRVLGKLKQLLAVNGKEPELDFGELFALYNNFRSET